MHLSAVTQPSQGFGSAGRHSPTELSRTESFSLLFLQTVLHFSLAPVLKASPPPDFENGPIGFMAVDANQSFSCCLLKRSYSHGNTLQQGKLGRTSSSEPNWNRRAEAQEWLPYSALASATALANMGKAQLRDGK